MGSWGAVLSLVLLTGCELNTRGEGPSPVPAGDTGACQPGCGQRVCGDDGCGGSCGNCGAGESCTAEGQCEPSSPTDARLSDGGPAPDVGTPRPDAGAPDAGAPDAAGADAGPTGPCAKLAVTPVSLSGYSTDQYAWSDSACRPRSAALVRNDAADPGGSRGGFLREFVYEADGKPRTCRAQGGLRWNGWGYVVTHYGSGSTSSHDTLGTFRTVFAGEHHAIHEFKVRISPGGPVDVTVHWLFATGRDHPLYSITFDSSANTADKLKADTRSPYGNLNFDGIVDGSGAVAGVGWGDRYRFTTTGPGPVGTATPWDYTQTNVVPFVLEWASGADAEMGIVETRPFTSTVSAGDYGGGMLADCWTRTSANPGPNCVKDAAGDAMFASWLWPYQLNQYELPYTTKSKRLAWGANYGAIGQGAFDSLGRKGLSGHPFTSYAVWLVLGKHSARPVEAQVAQSEAAQATRLTASVGKVATSGPAGVGRTDLATWAPAGWNHVLGTWDLQATGDKVQVVVTPGAALVNPIFRVLDFGGAAPASVTLGGTKLTAGTDYFASVDAANRVLWLTLKQTLSAETTLAVE